MTQQREHAAAGPSEPLPPAYRPGEVEDAVYQRWLAADFFSPDGAGSTADASRPPFVVIQPPPNVTAALHLGHALTSTIEDAMVRQARMRGHPTLWLPGLDHASIAAQIVLDRLLADEGKSRESLGRDRYLGRMRRFMDETRAVMLDQERRLGLSLDWSRLQFTMDGVSARAVRHSFKRLYDEGLAYRGERLINWCPGCRTSLSDLEVVPTPERGTLWFVRYHVADASGAPTADQMITVATTRPETILGDTAVAVHPDDDRYRARVGQRVVIPFVDRVVPIIADPVVDPAFGSGAVKITPAHDPNDYETGRRHGLAIVDVMDDEGRMSEAAGPFAGLGRAAARSRIVERMEAAGDLAEARPHEMLIGRCQRSGDVVEPRIKTQWFVRMEPLAARAMAAVRDGRTRILPARFEKVFFDWLENIRDWNVSRQLWWGHRIPAWYCPDGHITVSELPDGPEHCDACDVPSSELTQDEDIFDTWYSSGLWPFSTLGWPDATSDYERFYPGTVMETGYDIIFFWVARMMMLGEWLTGREPFATVYLHGMVRDPFGKKMSKTTGNVIDPLDLMRDFGADALRFALAAGTTPGADQRLSPSRLEGARNFANKLWNATRFVLGARPAEIVPATPLALPAETELGLAERWIVGRCGDTIDAVTRAYDAFDYSEAARLVHDALWSEYCDWYLEIAKVRLETAPPASRGATWWTLAWVLDRYLRLLHPLMPFVTERLWAELPHEAADPQLLAVARWPVSERERAIGGSGDAAAVEALLELVRAIRNTRAESGVEASSWVEAHVLFQEPDMASAHDSLREPFGRLARLRPVTVHADRQRLESSTAGSAALSVILPGAQAVLLRPAVDSARERARIARELLEARRLLGAAESRLANQDFVRRAPAAVVEGARRRAAELREQVVRLETEAAS